MSSATLELVQQLIRLRSVTPEDAGCQDLIARRLKPLESIYRQVLGRLLLPA